MQIIPLAVIASLLIHAVAGMTFSADLSPVSSTTAEGEAPTGKLSLDISDGGKYTLTLTDVKDFTYAYITVDGKRVFILRGPKNLDGAVSKISLTGTATFSDVFKKELLEGGIATVEELDKAIEEGRAAVVVATDSSPDGLLKGTITMS